MFQPRNFFDSCKINCQTFKNFRWQKLWNFQQWEFSTRTKLFRRTQNQLLQTFHFVNCNFVKLLRLTQNKLLKEFHFELSNFSQQNAAEVISFVAPKPSQTRKTFWTSSEIISSRTNFVNLSKFLRQNYFTRQTSQLCKLLLTRKLLTIWSSNNSHSQTFPAAKTLDEPSGNFQTLINFQTFPTSPTRNIRRAQRKHLQLANFLHDKL